MYNGMTESKVFKDFKLENISPNTTTTASPDASSTTSDSPTPTNSIREKNWANHYQTIGSAVCEKQHELIGTEEEQRQLLGTEEESSDKHSSDGESDVDDVWTITEEQHQYYEKQFKVLQPDKDVLINGSIAKKFFVKSRLNINELKKIWQLADITKDGALSLQEFKLAMHLVVLRRNDIPVPDTLPDSLVSSVLPISSPVIGNTENVSPPKGKEWTKFADSPTDSLSSPGPKPVNFDFSRASIEKNPKILHPVPLRLTPASDIVTDDKNEQKRPSVTDQITSDVSIKPIQRPQPKKHAVPGPGAIPPPPHSSSEESSGHSGPTSLPTHSGKKDPPPPPPPRPNRTHFRSSSLDLNKLGRNIGSIPIIPPRTSPAVAQGHPYFVDFNRNVPHGAFHVYQKDVKECSKTTNADNVPINSSTTDTANTDTTTAITTSVTSNSADCSLTVGASVDLLSTIVNTSAIGSSTEKKTPSKASVEDGNKYLRVFCAELQDELNHLREKRVALQTQLEKLHSRSPLPSFSIRGESG